MEENRFLAALQSGRKGFLCCWWGSIDCEDELIKDENDTLSFEGVILWHISLVDLKFLRPKNYAHFLKSWIARFVASFYRCEQRAIPAALPKCNPSWIRILSTEQLQVWAFSTISISSLSHICVVYLNNLCLCSHCSCKARVFICEFRTGCKIFNWADETHHCSSSAVEWCSFFGIPIPLFQILKSKFSSFWSSETRLFWPRVQNWRTLAN